MPMHGLVAYDDDSLSESEAGPSNGVGQNPNDKASKSGPRNSVEGRRIPKSQIIIKRPHNSHKNHHPRAHLSEDIPPEPPKLADEPLPQDETSSMDMSVSPTPPEQSDKPLDELSRYRAALEPPLILGLEDWGIPPECSAPCDPALQAKLAKFAALKQDPVNPKHFNDSLMSNRSFRNPHLYTKLVEFVNVDERATNFPQDIWSPNDVKPDWFADQIANAQKERSDKLSASQTSGKRTQIDFARPREKQPALQRKSRFQPYGSGAGASAARDKPKTRWG
ncbi:hypothetical protein NLJ89_g1693 [Agrocybe chaxingu]|uniref:HCNGP-domain-containing protein n=1 Tax=Agrocybe chaxingu TaxID=84603 RepID=A0A9W8MZJ7_9AGAR|nr:hypothetical protein NLJ89_g1693 [Agrocybe chaxingu]